MMEEKFKVITKLVNYKDAVFLSVVSFLFVTLRIPSFIEPYWYGDEGIYQVIGMAMNRGRLLYEGIWDNKPPLLYIIYAIFDGEQFYVRVASLIAGLIAVAFFFLLAKKLFKTNFSVYSSTALFSILFAIPTLEGNIANAENFMLAPVIAAFYLVITKPFKKKIFNSGFAGLLFSFAFLIKIVAVFDLAALLFSILILKFYENNSTLQINFYRLIKKFLLVIREERILLAAFIIPILLCVIYFIFTGAFFDFLRAAFSQNVGYVGQRNDFIIPNGLLFVKLLLLGASVLLVASLRNLLGFNGVIILIWLAFSLYSVFFSQRPYTHYVLVALPALTLFIGYAIENIKLLKITIPILIIVLFLINSTFHPNFFKNTAYYQNYFEFVMGSKTLDAYRAYFDRNTPRDYMIADFIKTKTSEKEGVFLWGDSGQIYALAGKLPPGRYIVAYHITFYPEAIMETKRAIDTARPKYIIQTKEDEAINNFLANYEIRYKMEGVNIYERQF